MGDNKHAYISSRLSMMGEYNSTHGAGYLDLGILSMGIEQRLDA
jgi:hypothetical protein